MTAIDGLMLRPTKVPRGAVGVMFCICAACQSFCRHGIRNETLLLYYTLTHEEAAMEAPFLFYIITTVFCLDYTP